MTSPNQTSSCIDEEDNQTLLRSLALNSSDRHYDEDSGDDDDECCSPSAAAGKKAEKAKWTAGEVRNSAPT